MNKCVEMGFAGHGEIWWFMEIAGTAQRHYDYRQAQYQHADWWVWVLSVGEKPNWDVSEDNWGLENVDRWGLTGNWQYKRGDSNL